MTYSKDGLALTEKFEGFRLTAYQDVGGVWTIGYGHTKDVQPGQVISINQADQFLMDDIQYAEDTVNELVTVKLTQSEFDALVDFVFNVGEGNFKNSTMLKLLNSGQYLMAATEFAKWSHVSGKIVADLLNRRITEEKEFVSDIDLAGE